MPFINNPSNNILMQAKQLARNATHSPIRVDVIEDIAKKDSSDDKLADLKNVRYDEITGELITDDHPCQRDCSVGEDPMICYYHFKLEWYQTMSKACFNCPYNESDCFRHDCIPADGMNRALNVINRKMPGPAIEVGTKFKIEHRMSNMNIANFNPIE